MMVEEVNRARIISVGPIVGRIAKIIQFLNSNLVI